jgi:hypothetical protein
LVAHLVRKNLELLTSHENKFLDEENFKFVFFVSFTKREESIALDLCEGLKKVCEKYGKKNFEFYFRFSNESKERWDSKFLEK